MKALVLISVTLLIGVVSSEFVCDYDESYIENDCNNCFCTASGLACHQMRCIEKYVPNLKCLQNCEIGTKYMKDCNQCECLEIYGTVCTNRDCSTYKKVTA